MTSSPLRNAYETPQSQHQRAARRDRSSPRGRHGSSPSSAVNFSPGRWESLDSPSRQLIAEFTRVNIDSDRLFKEKLDRINAEQERLHQEALDIAARKHADVLKCAELARDTLRRQVELMEAERRQREEEMAEQARQEQAAKAAAERKKKLEQAQEAEKKRQEAEDQARAAAEAEARTKAENDRKAAEAKQIQEKAAQHKLEAEARAKAEQDQKAQEAQQAQQALEAARKAAITTKPAPTTPSKTALSAVITPKPNVEAEHNAYVQVHKKLKEMRQYIKAQHKQCMEAKRNTGVANPAIEEMSDMRRELTKLMGQLTGDNKKNLAIRQGVKGLLEKASNMNAVTLDAREFIIRPTSPWVEGSSTQVPAVFVYLLNLLVKLSLKAMPTSASNKAYNAVDPIGILACWVFSVPQYHIQGNSFVDILLAKYHVVCPPLFGIYGSEDTQQGRTRLGWARESAGGPWLPQQLHYDKLAGISVGWAALTLRDFSKSTNRNPLPAWYYWRSLSYILDVPAAEITTSHGIILKGMIDQYSRSFYKFYGNLAITALRAAVVDLPAAAAAQNNSALQGVSVLKDTLKAKYDLAL